MHNGSVRFIAVPLAILVLMTGGCSAINPFSRDTAAPKPVADNAPPDWQPDKTPNHLALARKLVRQGHYEVAMRQLADARKTTPNTPEVDYLTGVCHRETGDLQSARTHFLQAITLDAGYAPAFDGLGLTCFLMNRPAEAREALEKAIALNPANADYNNNLGVLDMRQNRLAAARSRFEQCLRLEAGHSRCVNNLAECLVRLDRDKDALTLLQTHLTPAIAFNNLGAAYLATGRPEQARQLFLQALTHDPDLASARHNLNRMDSKEIPQP